MLEAEGLSKTFRVPHPSRRFGTLAVEAVRGVSVRVERGKTLGIVGESGSGKSTLARMLTLLLRPDAGGVRFGGKDVRRLKGKALRAFRRSVQIVFQDPLASLNPRIRVGGALAEPFEIHGTLRGRKLAAKTAELLERVGLPPAYAGRYPHALSGGERQRVAIARAIALDPEIVILDEPVSSLDVLVQAQILNLLLDLQAARGIGYLFISHDLRIVRHMSDEVAVMHDGRIVETGAAGEIFYSPREPYTRLLLSSIQLSELRRLP
jgi:ABC-type oligopeptide transport system ATPase subunit